MIPYGRRVALTFFTVPKSFEGRTGVIQRNALRSWKELGPDCQVIVCGDEVGIGEIAAELGVDQVPLIARNEFGTPLIGSAFHLVEEIAMHDVLCYANADIVFFPDLLDAVRRIATRKRRFLVVGETWDLEVEDELPVQQEDWEASLRRRVAAEGVVREPEAIDFFAFRRGTIGPLPEFAVGRPGWDNWLIWRARSLRIPVVNVSASVLAIHQSHDYGHVTGAYGFKWEGPEANANRALLGFSQGRFSLNHATHELTASGLVPNRGGGLYRRLRADELLLRRWTIPVYRLLRGIHRSFRH